MEIDAIKLIKIAQSTPKCKYAAVKIILIREWCKGLYLFHKYFIYIFGTVSTMVTYKSVNGKKI